MDSSFTIEPSSGTASSRALRDPVPVREAVETELGGAKTVAAASDGGSKHGGSKQDEGRNPDHRPDHDQPPHDLLADPNSRDVIYRVRDVRIPDGEHPDQALLRQRAYHRLPLADAEPLPAPDDIHADIKA